METEHYLFITTKRVWEGPKNCTKWCGRLIQLHRGVGVIRERSPLKTCGTSQVSCHGLRRSGRVQTAGRVPAGCGYCCGTSPHRLREINQPVLITRNWCSRPHPRPLT